MSTKSTILMLFPTPINSLFLSYMMMEDKTDIELANRREHPIDVHAVFNGEQYIVYAEDGVEVDVREEPLWCTDKVKFLSACKHWYGKGVQVLIEEYVS
jgi:hypothetical protein